jgi:hypothetical protein
MMAACVTSVGAGQADVAALRSCAYANVGDPCDVNGSRSYSSATGTCQVVGGPEMLCLLPHGLVVMGPVCQDNGEGEPCQVVTAGLDGGAGATTFNGTCGMHQTSSIVCVAARGLIDLNSNATYPPTQSGGCSLGSVSTRRTFGPWLLAGSVAVLIALLRRRRS